ncbi:calcium-binding protein SPEC 1A [Strongylocentrotus purpuratus]|uniref:Calcium-binding protein SPEC 1A n=1 Tax=Strongylocentrotus purpuratus TaxID=7668 RepID=SPE1A_STRPU|nr:calcium-binding protein SPEC 1A [Strongylocentrotus purpuratus]P04109.3 RecName: Full=Calcium-binding protein SPEC 1A [Strongylocentrotus purpuratus]CAA27036.1 unnamed protein product [Strongylocentrotus purpuratus]|eukprot:NP_999768.1 calcium-binding protein SPEC 1A [Strongylocentrotus purpuratus]
MAAQLLFTDEEVTEFKRRFKNKDTDKSKSITAEELGEFFKSTGKSYTDKQIDKMISDVDTDESGTIDFSEMLMGIAEQMVKWTWKEEHYTKAFDDMDKDGNGSLSPQELREALSASKPPMKRKKIKAIIQKADANKDGKIDREEFMKLIKSC